ncbi:MAG TPA: hypothetical protein VK421_14380 [Pyrinomonadaceae bacterium]|nr:hypothetical protein [Pyrinomonadaceae bacterium]
MTRRLITTLAAAVALLCAAPAARADVMLKQRSSARPGDEVTLYLKGAMQRREFKLRQPDGRFMTSAHLDDCARRQFVWLDPVNRRYTVFTGGLPVAAFAAFNEQQFPLPMPPQAKGTLTETTAVTDTGERREMFGFTARRLTSVTTWAAAPEACDSSRTARIETDGWYVDLLHGVDCSADLSGASPRIFIDFAGDGCLNKRLRGKYFFRRVYTGGARFGFPLAETTRTYDARGRVRTETTEVTELSTAALDDALFNVPAGYVRVEPGKRRGPQSALSRVLSIFR